MSESWDVFVCHATEDKGIVRPLAETLQRRGLSVWYDEFTLKLGDSLRDALDRGLRNSSFGVVVLSPAFFSKQWPQWELNGLVTRQLADRRRIIIPIWHNITAHEVRAQSPSLADLIAANTASGLATVAEQVLDAVSRVALTESSTSGRHGRADRPAPLVVSPRPTPSAKPASAVMTPPTPTRSNAPTRRDRSPEVGLLTGVVKWWSDDKGFGFLTPDGGGKDVFAHHPAILGEGYRTLVEGARVEFAIEQSDRGPKAARIRMIQAMSGPDQPAPETSADPPPGRLTGWVKWWSDDKGFGFLTPDGGGKDVFVHHPAVLGDGYRTLVEGARVEFAVEQGEKGPKAANVRMI